MLVVSVLAMLAVAALPTLAQHRDNHNNDNHNHNNNDNHHFFGGNGGVSQELDQNADSGDVNQSFDVSNTGDNSNQCVGITGNANTGNAQNQIGVIQYGSRADDFDFNDTGANLDVSGTSTTTCDQQVNQAAAAG
jgi:hypothetical protein